MATAEKNLHVALPPELVERIEAAAQAEGKTVDEWTQEAAQKKLLDQRWQKLTAQGDERRRRLGLSEAQAQALVDRAIHEHRQERSR